MNYDNMSHDNHFAIHCAYIVCYMSFTVEGDSDFIKLAEGIMFG